MTQIPAPGPVAASANTYPGTFITFEGGDLCGKSTQIELLANYLAEAGVPYLRTREPGGTDLGQQLRQIVLHSEDPIDPRCEALIFAADRAHHIATLVRPALAAGQVVLADRYFDSSIAYQGAARELGADQIRDLNLWATGGLTPTVTFLFDGDPQVMLERGGASLDRLESEPLEYHRRVRAHYLEIAAAEAHRVVVLDATAPIADLQTQIRGHLQQRKILK